MQPNILLFLAPEENGTTRARSPAVGQRERSHTNHFLSLFFFTTIDIYILLASYLILFRRAIFEVKILHSNEYFDSI